MNIGQFKPAGVDRKNHTLWRCQMMRKKPKWSKYFSLGVACLLLSTVIAPTRAQGEPTVVIPYLDTGYKYKVVAFDADSGFEQPGFDDSGFSTGDAGFGTPFGGCSLNNPTDVKTTWPLDTDILLRKQFNLPPGTTNLEVGVAIDNDVQVFINGQDISGGLILHEGCAERDSFIFTTPDGILNAGTNLLAVRGRDRGGLSYLDVKVTAGIPGITEVPVDIKPQGCPNPLNVKSRGVLPVAILGTATFDVTQVDVSTVKLEGVSPLRNALEDVATPFVPFTGKTHPLDCTDAGPDGFLDLTLKFGTQAVIAALGSVTDGEVRVLKLTGNLTDGTPIRGEDVVVIIFSQQE